MDAAPHLPSARCRETQGSRQGFPSKTPLFVLFLLISVSSHDLVAGQNNSPQDKPVASNAEQLRKLQKAMARRSLAKFPTISATGTTPFPVAGFLRIGPLAVISEQQ
jgi:hypothetical protein